MSLTKPSFVPSLIAALALVGTVTLLWLSAPTAEAREAVPGLPCTSLNVGATVVLSSGTCHHDLPAWTEYTCTERNGRFFWLAGDVQCGDVISLAPTP